MNSHSIQGNYEKTCKKQRHQDIKQLIEASTQDFSHPSITQTIDSELSKTIKHITNLISLVICRLKYSPITHFASLLMLNSFKSQVMTHPTRLIAFTTVTMAGKVYQSEVPKYSKLIKWGKGEFDKQQLVLMQAEILKQNDYSVPIIWEDLSQDEIRTKISKLQQIICSCHPENFAKK